MACGSGSDVVWALSLVVDGRLVCVLGTPEDSRNSQYGNIRPSRSQNLSVVESVKALKIMPFTTPSPHGNLIFYTHV